MKTACQIILVSNAFLPMTLRVTLRTVSGVPALPDPRDARVGVDEHDHVALRERLRSVRAVVRRIRRRESS